jgi:hypothetical protein
VRDLLTLVLVAAVVFAAYRVWLFAREYTLAYGAYTSLLASGDVVVFVGAEGHDSPALPTGVKLRVMSDATDSDSVSPNRPISLEPLSDPGVSGEIVVAKRKQLRLVRPAR